MADEYLTRLSVDEMVAAQKRAEISARRAVVLHEMELRFAELIGVDGDGGEWAAMKLRIDRMDRENTEIKTEIKALTQFKQRVVWTVGLMAGAASFVAAVALAIIQHFLK